MAKGKEGTTKIDKEMLTLDEILEVFQRQLEESQNDLNELDEVQSKQLEEILDKLPQGATPKGVLDEILKAATPKRTQILNNISKLQASIKIETVKKSKLGIEKRKLEDAIKEDGLNTLTANLCETFKTTLDKYLEFENSFINFKGKASELGSLDPMFFNRVDNSKYSDFYNQVFGLSLINLGSLPGLTGNHFITTIQNIGNPESNPLKSDKRFNREETMPIHRDITGKTEESEATETTAAEKLSEVFEPGPRVPTY